MGRPASDKRQRLVSAASKQFHKQGYARTSLADVAKLAGISAGNVFYYFKTKEDLARAVVDQWCNLLSHYLSELEPSADPWGALDRFIEQAGAMLEIYLNFGCPFAGLTRDLRQEGEGLKSEAARIYDVQFQWLAMQFARAGIPGAESEKRSRLLMSRYHGSILLAYVQNDPSIIEDEVEALKIWLKEIRDNGTAIHGS